MHIFSGEQLKLLHEKVFYDVSEITDTSWSRWQQDSNSIKAVQPIGNDVSTL